MPHQQQQPSTLDEPLYVEGRVSTRDSLRGYIMTFVNKGTSKQALSDILSHTASILPQPNNLPSSFAGVLSMISKECLQIKKVHACVMDCMFFNDEEVCQKCGESRYRQSRDSVGRRVARRVFSYSSIGQMLKLLFGCKNIAQVMQEAGGCRATNVMTDITDTRQWQEWMSSREGELVVALGLNTDGVNPYHGSNMKYSCWPLIFSIYNMPKFIRNKSDALLLYGVVPSRDFGLNNGIEPDLHIYQQLMVDELLQLVSVQIHSSYAEAPLQVKTQLLLYMMDFQGYAKYFHMTGAVSTLPCNRCLIASTRIATTTRSQPAKYKRVILGHKNYEPDVVARDYHVEVSQRLQRYIYFTSRVSFMTSLVSFMTSLTL